MASLSIGQVAKRTGLRTSALRYYEEAGILPSPARINRRRVYETLTLFAGSRSSNLLNRQASRSVRSRHCFMVFVRKHR
jgi:MerR-like DNA binding protein